MNVVAKAPAQPLVNFKNRDAVNRNSYGS
jgi:hypothetical protein